MIYYHEILVHRRNDLRTLGLIGGTSWHSTVEYYQSINQAVNDHFGDNTNPPLVLFNLNQSLVHQYQVEGNWTAIAELLANAGQRLEKAGAEAVMFCANTPHKVYDAVVDRTSVSILHIADATAAAIAAKGIRRVCFVGTKFSMEEDFVTGRIASHGIEVIVPSQKSEIDELHRIIQKELTFGRVESSSKQFTLSRLKALIDDEGAEGVVLGCTEFPLMISDADISVPVFNTTSIHAQAATDYILERV